MSNDWKQTAIISPGGTVFDLAADPDGRVWLATGAGIFVSEDDAWSPLPQGQPLSQLNALACADRIVLAGGSQGQVVYSSDGGQQWYQGQISQTQAPITCFAAAPNFRQSGLILAGTDGAGILRSTDRGRTWRLASFGLQEFSVIALANAPSWERREIAFAATAGGFYRSPNGGRAWKKTDADLDGALVQSIAVSPNFARDRTVLLGTERRGIFRSTDSGKRWQPWGQGLLSLNPPEEEADGELPPINGLWLHPEFATTPICLAATGDGQIFTSADGGQQWRRVATAESSILCLGRSGQRLLAGLLEQGLLSSTDGGQTWSSVSSLAARAFTRLQAGHKNQRLWAYGPLEQPHQSADGGQRWTPLEGLSGYGPLLTLAALPESGLLAASAAGLLRSGAKGWQMVIPDEEVLTICFSPRFSQDRRVWAGSSSGKLLISADGGQSWTEGSSPKPGLPLITLALLPGETLAAVTFAQDQQQLTLWRSPDGGATWQQWQQAGAGWPSAHVVPAGAEPERVLVCLERRVWLSAAAGWQRVLETERPITRLSRLADGRGFLALTARQLLHSPDGATWSACEQGLGGQLLLDLAPGPLTAQGQTVTVLTGGGLLWQQTF